MTLSTILGALVFAGFVVAQVAAVVAVHRMRNDRQPQAFDEVLRDPRARTVWYSGD